MKKGATQNLGRSAVTTNIQSYKKTTFFDKSIITLSSMLSKRFLRDETLKNLRRIVGLSELGHFTSVCLTLSLYGREQDWFMQTML